MSGMSFAWSPEQQAFRDVVVQFAQRELNDDVIERDRGGEFPFGAWKRLAELGIQGLPVSPEHGGGGADTLTIIAALEALGYGCTDNGLLFSLNAHMWACQHPISRFGTDEQKQRYLPPMCDGSLIGAHAMSEPESGSDAFALRTTATKVDGGWVLKGAKTFASNAPVAGVFIVFATNNPGRGFMGLCAFVVDAATAGLEVSAPTAKMGLRTSPMGDVFLDDCFVPETALLGKPGGGMAIFSSAMEIERSLILACSVGTMERELERSVRYAKERTQFGQPIGKFQAVANRLVGMKLRLETARLLLYRLGWLHDEGGPTGLAAALTKLHLSESFVASSLDAVQVHGGSGYTEALEVERMLRDAIGSRLYSGTSDIQMNLVARHLGL